MRATPVFHEKRLLEHQQEGTPAVAELKIWNVPKSEDYPEGRKFSLFLVSGGEVLVGIDNHKPKGPHLHLGNQELQYLYRDDRSLLEDFWDFVRKAGFKV